MIHLDLFSGIGGFSLGLKKVFNIEHTYYSEIDKYAIDVYKHNFKNSTYVKSVTDVRGRDLPRIDVITFGSPCQDFSLAGKRKGMDGERSSLISEAIRIIKECRPTFFIWENVKGTFSSNSGGDFWAIIQAFTNIGGYRLEWQLLNTKWFLPQNRERIYLVGYIGNGSGGQVFPITENNRQVDELQGQQANSADEKIIVGAVRGRYNKNKTEQKLELRKDSNTNTLTSVQKDNYVIGDFRNDEGYRPRKDGDSPCLARRRCSETDISTMPPIIKIVGYSRDSKGKVIKRNLKEEANTLHGSTGGGGNTDQYILKPRKKLNDNQQKKLDKLKVDPSISGTLTEAIGRGGSSSEYLSMLKKNQLNTGAIRRLTPIECERLQGFPDDWTKTGKELGTISDSQRYKMCGNAVTVDVVEAVAKKIILTLYN